MKITKNFLFNEYITKGLSLRKLAKRIGCGIKKLRIYLKKYDIPIHASGSPLKYISVLTEKFLKTEHTRLSYE